MSGVLDLVREDLRDFTGYSSARGERLQGDVWLNANESAWPGSGDVEGVCRRYPQPQPPALTRALARLYGCAPEQLLVGRGSDEAIDLLVRTLCVPRRDAVVVSPPVFGMYAVSARLQGAPLLEVPLVDGTDGFAVDPGGLVRAALSGGARLIFLCSPGNPTGNVIAAGTIAKLARALEGRALLVVDEAYIEFANVETLARHLDAAPNLAVLKTLSKAHGLAGARVGALLAHPQIIQLARKVIPPYAITELTVEAVVPQLTDTALARTRTRIARLLVERGRLAEGLKRSPLVTRVWPSDANFLLIDCNDADAVLERARNAGLIIRDVRQPALPRSLRISVGTPEQNSRLLESLS